MVNLLTSTINEMTSDYVVHCLKKARKETLIKKVIQVFETLKETFDQYKTSEIFLSFNGGKDCTVLLDLVKRFMWENNALQNEQLKVIYFRPENPFYDVEEFVDLCEKTYSNKIEKITGKLKNSLEIICKNDQNIKVVIMGSRRTDPFCNDLKTFQQTDKNWPKLLRVNPLLEWSYKDIWDYIKCCNIIYCCLYDMGYTSLGEQNNTLKNPHLKQIDSILGTEFYKPAYELIDETLERAGRF